MDEKFLESARREPRPEFTTDLRAKLARQAATTREPRRLALRPELAIAAGVVLAAAAALIAFPSVRASAEAFLDLFRVRNFTAVSFDRARMDKLRSLDAGKGLMVLEHASGEAQAPEPIVYPNAEAAGAAAGLDVRQPGYLPAGFALDTVMVEAQGESRMTVNEPKLRALLDALDLHDVTIPPGLNGQSVTVRRPPVVIQHFRRGRSEIALIQARSPEVTLPPGVDLERLGEIGLRILGLDAGEARHIAASIDWHSTLVIPVPLEASSFRHVTVQGNPGLLIQSRGEAGTEHERIREGTVILWSEGDRVFGVMSGLSGPDLIQVAESVR